MHQKVLDFQPFQREVKPLSPAYSVGTGRFHAGTSSCSMSCFSGPDMLPFLVLITLENKRASCLHT